MSWSRISPFLWVIALSKELLLELSHVTGCIRMVRQVIWSYVVTMQNYTAAYMVIAETSVTVFSPHPSELINIVRGEQREQFSGILEKTERRDPNVFLCQNRQKQQFPVCNLSRLVSEKQISLKPPGQFTAFWGCIESLM